MVIMYLQQLDKRFLHIHIVDVVLISQISHDSHSISLQQIDLHGFEFDHISYISQTMLAQSHT